MSQAVIVIYDGQCPLCSREISHYRRRRGAEAIRWLDVTAEPDRVRELGIEPQQALARFHVCDELGNWNTGAAAFAVLWSQLPAYVWLARLLRSLHLLPLMERAYGAWLAWRDREHCDSSCDAGKRSDT